MQKTKIRDAALATILIGVAAVAGQADAAMLALHAQSPLARAAWTAGAMGMLATGTIAAAYAVGILLVHAVEAHRRLSAR